MIWLPAQKGCTGSCSDLLLYFRRVCNELYACHEIQRLLNGYRKGQDGTIIVADEGVIIASNNTGLIGQSTTDYGDIIQKLKNHETVGT